MSNHILAAVCLQHHPTNCCTVFRSVQLSSPSPTTRRSREPPFPRILSSITYSFPSTFATPSTSPSLSSYPLRLENTLRRVGATNFAESTELISLFVYRRLFLLHVKRWGPIVKNRGVEKRSIINPGLSPLNLSGDTRPSSFPDSSDNRYIDFRDSPTRVLPLSDPISDARGWKMRQRTASCQINRSRSPETLMRSRKLPSNEISSPDVTNSHHLRDRRFSR